MGAIMRRGRLGVQQSDGQGECDGPSHTDYDPGCSHRPISLRPGTTAELSGHRERSHRYRVLDYDEPH